MCVCVYFSSFGIRNWLMIMEVEKSHRLQSLSYRTRRANGVASVWKPAGWRPNSGGSSVSISGQSQTMTDFPVKTFEQKEFFLLRLLVLFRSCCLGGDSQWSEQSPLLIALIEILISSRNTLIEISRVLFDQISDTCGSVKWTYKISHHNTKLNIINLCIQIYTKNIISFIKKKKKKL